MTKKEITSEELTARALCLAQKAFEDYISNRSYDPAYWDIRFTAWLKDSSDLKRYKRVEIECELEEKNEKT